jgi:hypothetical protein
LEGLWSSSQPEELLGLLDLRCPPCNKNIQIPYPTAGESISIQLETLQFYPWSEYFIRSQRWSRIPLGNPKSFDRSSEVPPYLQGFPDIFAVDPPPIFAHERNLGKHRETIDTPETRKMRLKIFSCRWTRHANKNTAHGSWKSGFDKFDQAIYSICMATCRFLTMGFWSNLW